MNAKEILDQNWRDINKKIMEMNEEELKKLLETEQQNKKRIQYLLRIYGRYNTLRTERERNELAAG